MADQGHAARSQVIKQARIPARGAIAERLDVVPGAPVMEIERLRFVNDEPIVLVTSYVPYLLCPSLLDADLTVQSLYSLLEDSCGLRIVCGRRTLEAVSAGDYEARLLRVPVGAPLVLLNSVSYLADGAPVEYYFAFHRGDRSRFDVQLIRVRDDEPSPDPGQVDASSLPRSNRLIGLEEGCAPQWPGKPKTL